MSTPNVVKFGLQRQRAGELHSACDTLNRAIGAEARVGLAVEFTMCPAPADGTARPYIEASITEAP